MSEQPKGTRPPFEHWAVVELMGHVRLAGHVTEQELFGAKLGRIEIPQKDGSFVSQLFGGASVYRITPVTEAVARQVALNTTYMPVSVWDFPRPALPRPDDEDPNPGRHDRPDTGDDYDDEPDNEPAF